MRSSCFTVLFLCALAGCGGGERQPEIPEAPEAPAVVVPGVVTPPVVVQPPSAVDPVPQAFRDAAAAWANAGAQNYHFTFDTVCFCAPVADPSRLGVIRVVVRGGVIASATFPFSGAVATARELAQLPTMTQLFDIGVKAYQREGGTVSFQAGGTPVHLLKLAIDYSRLVADDEITYLVSDFALD